MAMVMVGLPRWLFPFVFPSWRGRSPFRPLCLVWIGFFPLIILPFLFLIPLLPLERISIAIIIDTMSLRRRLSPFRFGQRLCLETPIGTGYVNYGIGQLFRFFGRGLGQKFLGVYILNSSGNWEINSFFQDECYTFRIGGQQTCGKGAGEL